MAVSAVTSRRPRTISETRLAGTPIAVANPRALPERLHKLFPQDFTRMRSQARHRALPLMIIDDLDLRRSVGRPAKADTPLMIYPYAPLPCPVSFQTFEPVSRRGAQILHPNSRIQHIELAGGGFLERAPLRRGDAVPEKLLGRAMRYAMRIVKPSDYAAAAPSPAPGERCRRDRRILEPSRAAT